MAAAGTAPHHLESLARGHPLRPLLVPAQLLQQQRRPHAERARQRDQGLQAGGDVPGFQSAEHPGADPGGGRHIRQRQILALAHAPRDGAQLPADVGRGDRRYAGPISGFWVNAPREASLISATVTHGPQLPCACDSIYTARNKFALQ